MIKKGVISNINGTFAEAIIPEADNVVTAKLPLVKGIDPTTIKVGDNCVIALFDTDNINLANGAIIAIY